jgi:hypothetical protein
MEAFVQIIAFISFNALIISSIWLLINWIRKKPRKVLRRVSLGSLGTFITTVIIAAIFFTPTAEVGKSKSTQALDSSLMRVSSPTSEQKQIPITKSDKPKKMIQRTERANNAEAHADNSLPGLTLEQKMRIFKELYAAEVIVDSLASKKVPFNLWEAIEIGGNYKTTKRTPLMPDPNPTDVIRAWQKVIQMPAGTSFKVISASNQSTGNIWYYFVETKYGQGWINEMALMNQGEPDNYDLCIERRSRAYDSIKVQFDKQIRRKYGINQEQLDRISREGISKRWH